MLCPECRLLPCVCCCCIVSIVPNNMPNSCCISGCSSRGDRDAHVAFFRIPAATNERGQFCELKAKRRRKWIEVINQTMNENALKYARVCSKHFVRGKPVGLHSTQDIDWAPSQNLNKIHNSKEQSPVSRYGGLRKKRKIISMLNQLSNSNKENGNTDENGNIIDDADNSNNTTCVFDEPTSTMDEILQQIEQLNLELHNRNSEIYKMRLHIKSITLEQENFKDDDQKTLFYTGLPHYFMLEFIVQLVAKELPKVQMSLTPFQQVLLTLMKLRLNLLFTDLAYRFNIHRSTASRYFFKIVTFLYYKLKNLVRWPDRDEIQCVTPKCFQEYFQNKVAAIVDCFEVFIERPSLLDARAQTWSQYKHHNTVKFLISITPQGFISFISKAYGGRTSDTYITENCNILNNLLPGDIVLADRGFRIDDSVRLYMAEVRMPAFRKRGNPQLHPIDVEETRHLANVRIHVERAIGHLRQKYTILFNKSVPITILHNNANESVQSLDKIVHVCCALTNLCPSVMKI